MFWLVACLSFATEFPTHVYQRSAEIQIFQIISKVAQVVVKHFWPRSNTTKMFLFPLLYRGQRISNFEKIDIFDLTADFWYSSQGP